MVCTMHPPSDAVPAQGTPFGHCRLSERSHRKNASYNSNDDNDDINNDNDDINNSNTTTNNTTSIINNSTYRPLTDRIPPTRGLKRADVLTAACPRMEAASTGNATGPHPQVVSTVQYRAIRPN